MACMESAPVLNDALRTRKQMAGAEGKRLLERRYLSTYTAAQGGGGGGGFLNEKNQGSDLSIQMGHPK